MAQFSSPIDLSKIDLSSSDTFPIDLSDIGHDSLEIVLRANLEMGLPISRVKMAVCGMNSAHRRAFIDSMRRNAEFDYVSYYDVPLPNTPTSAREFYVNHRLYVYTCIHIVSDGNVHDLEMQLTSELLRRKHPVAMVVINTDHAIKEIALRQNKSMNDSALDFRLQLCQYIKGCLPQNFPLDFVDIFLENFLFLISCSALEPSDPKPCYKLERNGYIDESLSGMDETYLLAKVKGVRNSFVRKMEHIAKTYPVDVDLPNTSTNMIPMSSKIWTWMTDKNVISVFVFVAISTYALKINPIAFFYELFRWVFKFDIPNVQSFH